MHFGQSGLEQMKHFSTANWPGCFKQGVPATEAAAGASAAATAAGVWTRTANPDRGGGGGGGGGAASSSSNMPTGAAAVTAGCGGVDVARSDNGMGTPWGVAVWPSSCLTRPSTNSDASRRQAGQMNFTGLVAIAGVRSNSYLAPHAHWTFMARLMNQVSRVMVRNVTGSAMFLLVRPAAQTERALDSIRPGHHRTGNCRRTFGGYSPAPCRYPKTPAVR